MAQHHDVSDDAMPHGGHNKFRSSASNYHAPNPPTSPLVSPSHSPMDIDSPLPPSDQAIKTLDRISSLELALCSNFTCCSIKLPDLHALVEHFEEKHVVAINIDGKRIYPENTSGKRLAVFPPMPPSLSNSPSSSRSSSPPTPTIPLATAPFLDYDQTSAKQMSWSTESGGVYTPFSGMMFPPPDEDPYGLFDSLDTYPVLSTSPPAYHSDFPSHAQASCSSSSSPSITSRSHDPMILNPDCHSDVIITVHDLDYNHDNNNYFDGEENKKKKTKKDVATDREAKKVVHRPKVDNNGGLNMTAVSAKNAAKTKFRLLGGNNVKRREKAYRCPKAGCTKSYLNPNGLKYHLEKGTCHIEVDSTTEGVTTPESSSILTTNSTQTTALPPPHEHTTPRQNAPSSTPYSLPFLKIENYITAMQRNRTPISMMMPTPPATPGSESPNCETNLPLPGGSIPGPVYRAPTIPSPSSAVDILSAPVSLPVPVAPTPITPTETSMLLPPAVTGMMMSSTMATAGGLSQAQPMSP